MRKNINSYYFIEVLSKCLNSKYTVVTDMGLSFVGTHQAFKLKKGQDYLQTLDMHLWVGVCQQQLVLFF